MTVALARLVGHGGRVYAVDIDPARRDQVAQAAAEAGEAQVVAITQAAEEVALPEEVDLAYCRFLLLHVVEPLTVLRRMASITRAGGWVVAQEPVTSAGRVGGTPLSMPGARHPDVGALLPALATDAGLELVDAWAEAPAGAGPGPVADYLEDLTGVSPGNDPVRPAPAGHGCGPQAGLDRVRLAFQPEQLGHRGAGRPGSTPASPPRPRSPTPPVTSPERQEPQRGKVAGPDEELLPQGAGQEHAPLDHRPYGLAGTYRRGRGMRGGTLVGEQSPRACGPCRDHDDVRLGGLVLQAHPVQPAKSRGQGIRGVGRDNAAQSGAGKSVG